MTKNYFLGVALIFCFSMFSQKNQNLQNLQNKYSIKDIENQKSLFLHLSKTKFLPGEDLWFSSYAFNHKTLRPVSGDQKIHIQILNRNGNILESKTYLSSLGHAEGMIELSDKKFRSGEYLLVAYTDSKINYFSQAIEILGPTQKNINTKELDYDLQLLPEGGHLVEDILNSVAVKLIDSKGQGIYFSEAYLVDENQDTLTNFSSNKFGLAKFPIIPKKDVEYSVVIPNKVQKYSAKLPEIERNGITLSANSLQGQIIFSAKTNQITNENIRNNKYFLGVEDRGEIKFYEFHFPENQLQVNIAIEKDSLIPGTHRATLFDENLKPIAERIVFNNRDFRSNINLEITDNSGDSLQVKISLKDKTAALFSISTLPASTIAYGNQQNIFYTAFIKPYVNGLVEQPAYYFDTEMNERERLYDLDLLFLSQGWSKYDWENTFESNAPIASSNIGYSIEGRIQSDFDDSNKILIKSTDSGLFEVLDIQKNGSFKMDSLFVLKDSEISIGLLNKRNNVTKPVLFAKILPRESNLSIETTGADWFYDDTEFSASDAGDFRNFTRNTTQLDTLTINVKKKRVEEVDLDPFMKRTPMTDVKIVDDNMRSSFALVLDYIRSRGFTVRSSISGVMVCKRATGLGGCTPARIYLDGMELGDDSGRLSNLMTENISAISINNSGIGLLQPSQGNGGGGVIRIQTRKNYETENKYNEETTFKLKAKNGFSLAKEYYNPKYGSYTSSLFENYGIIDWQPLVYFSKDKSDETFKILNTTTKMISFYVEGITGDGKLISQRIDMDL
ncbi:hypothetical protein [Christiangramia sp. SM2212]|uniref:TonB-dependent receptor plug domain-containing protein n=1 Tax=Christiangramia sediminicola TaxID=3073267 RepID=A0ABU1EM49_9FLAO|nr:hypothetical protein [Christiangramia sp. SM2212]MDR5589460.1 hypothetical protein [Christiangramia sp. SM2212]